jgi:hypothetical protein
MWYPGLSDLNAPSNAPSNHPSNAPQLQKSIVINNITFTLINKSKENINTYINTDPSILECIQIRDNLPKVPDNVKFKDSRDLIHFTSKKGENIRFLNSYRSISELGIWRLAYHGHSKHGKKYNCVTYDKMNRKTEDYVQSTVIHHKLQKFFTENFESIPFVKHEETFNELIRPDGMNDETYAKNSMLNLSYPTDDDIAMIDNVLRCKIVKPFNQFISDGIPKCGTPINHEDKDIITKFKSISDKIENKYEAINNSSVRKFIYKNSFKSIIDKIHNCDTTMYEINLYTYKDTKRPNTQDDVILIYCKYVVDYETKTGGIKTVTGCYGVALIPFRSRDNNINDYGIYLEFIPAGKFICKPFDYQRQCINIKENNICGDYYAYIGNIYNDMYPYSKLAALDDLDDTILSGGKQNFKTLKHKTIKHKTIKYKKLKHKTTKYKTIKHKTTKYKIIKHKTLKH